MREGYSLFSCTPLFISELRMKAAVMPLLSKNGTLSLLSCTGVTFSDAFQATVQHHHPLAQV
jgi:hypothetical protein